MDDEIVKEFLIESYENLDNLDRELLELEHDPGNQERLAGVFRTIHTIKGGSGFLGFNILESVTHVGESLLSKVRDGALPLDVNRTSLLLMLIDAIRSMLSSIESSGVEGAERYEELCDALRRSTSGDATAGASKAVNEVGATGPAVESAQPTDSAEETAAPAPAEVVTANKAKPAEKVPHDDTGHSVSESTVRVDVGLLDTLMNLVGELVLARNQIIQHAQSQTDHAFVGTTQRLNLITTELQEGVMKTRMQPIASVWNKFPRVVRDLAMACHKDVTIEMEGMETELDRTIIAAIKDPLTHVIRNSVDHGIESPDEREARGKPRQGVITARAYHEGGQVNIEISDDGAGVDPARVKDKALSRGLITREQADKMSDSELAYLIFKPGFSTAAAVSAISGRGVGMDVVKTNIEKIGGAVDLANRPGEGLTLKIKIPLTLAIIPALIVETGGERFAIPQVNLLELVRLEGEQARAAVELIHGTPVYRLRGDLLALAYLNRELEMGPPLNPDVLNIVVLQAAEQAFGLVVDAVNDTEEIVVKPLGRELKGLSVYAGTTIMGDGRVALILDIMGVARRAGVVGRSTDDAVRKSATQQSGEGPSQPLLLFRAGSESQLAIPLSAVARLEELPRHAVERAAGQDVAQYRGAIMPLVHLGHTLGAGASLTDAEDPLLIVVYTLGDRSIGLVVDEILDIANERVVVEMVSPRRGLLGSAVIGGRVTDVVDVRAIIETVDATFFAASAA